MSNYLQRPTTNDPNDWKVYWKAQGQYWRTEPEIDTKRQMELANCRTVIPDIKEEIYPFKGRKLSRADVEWLLATHDNGQGPVDWDDESQSYREGLDLRGADLRQQDLSYLPLARLRGGLAWNEWYTFDFTDQQRNVAGVLMQGAILREAKLQGAELYRAHLEEADLFNAQLQGAVIRTANMNDTYLRSANLEGAYLNGTNLERAYLQEANLKGVDLQRANLDRAYLGNITIADEKQVGPRLADVRWGNVNLSVVDWKSVVMLGDEYEARQRTQNGIAKDQASREWEYKAAVRANRQLVVVLRDQGLNEEADYFAYRAQVLQRKVFWFQRSGQQVKFRQSVQSLRRWLFSWFLNVVAGYGYRPYRCFLLYFFALIGFTIAHYIVGAVAGSPLSFLNALAVSVQSLHGRLFSFQSSDPQTLLNTIEAFVGLFIEAIIVAVITQRILGK